MSDSNNAVSGSLRTEIKTTPITFAVSEIQN